MEERSPWLRQNGQREPMQMHIVPPTVPPLSQEIAVEVSLDLLRYQIESLSVGLARRKGHFRRIARNGSCNQL